MTTKYEILDGMEVQIATADTIDDARYALANVPFAKMIVRTDDWSVLDLNPNN